MKRIESIALIGRGAIGTLFATLFLKQDVPFVFLVDKARKEKYEKNGLIVNGQPCDFKYVTNVEEFQKVDLVFISTKYSGLESAIQLMRNFVKEDTIIVSSLNGISSEEILRKAYPNNPVVRTIVQGMDSTYLNNEVVYTVLGELLFGKEFETEKEACILLEEFYQRMKVPYRVCEDIIFDQWNKLMFNCGINQTCAAFYTTYGGCKQEGPLKDIFVSAMREVKEVANRKGIQLTEHNIETWISVLKGLGDEGMPSMRQDIIARRKTEKELFSGTIIPYAQEINMSVPVLTELYNRITKIESDF